MAEPSLDVLAIGNAIVDVIAPADEALLEQEGLAKGSMRLIDAEAATRLYGRMGPGREASGGSAANTAAGVAALGARAGFIGQVADDQLGEVFAHDIRAMGVAFDTPAKAGGEPTARCLVLVTPDAQRTMNTFLGASQGLTAEAIDSARIADAAILYLEGYLWDPEAPRAAMRQAIAAARVAGRRVSITLSDIFCVERHGDDFRALIEACQIDILFANEAEAMSLERTDDLEAAIASLALRVPLLVVTRSERGALAVEGGQRHEVPAEPVAQVVDTTGAGDLFAAGFLAGLAAGRPVPACLTMGAVAAAEVISHYGARPEADLRALVAARLAL